MWSQIEATRRDRENESIHCSSEYFVHRSFCWEAIIKVKPWQCLLNVSDYKSPGEVFLIYSLFPTIMSKPASENIYASTSKWISDKIPASSLNDETLRPEYTI